MVASRNVDITLEYISMKVILGGVKITIQAESSWCSNSVTGGPERRGENLSLFY